MVRVLLSPHFFSLPSSIIFLIHHAALLPRSKPVSLPHSKPVSPFSKFRSLSIPFSLGLLRPGSACKRAAMLRPCWPSRFALRFAFGGCRHSGVGLGPGRASASLTIYPTDAKKTTQLQSHCARCNNTAVLCSLGRAFVPALRWASLPAGLSAALVEPACNWFKQSASELLPHSRRAPLFRSPAPLLRGTGDLPLGVLHPQAPAPAIL